jgi:DNA-binding beta-propeller fold protein YncE
MKRRRFVEQLLAIAFVFLQSNSSPAHAGDVHRYLYVAEPGVRDYTQYGGQGILVFDMDNGHRFVRRIDSPAGKENPRNIKGICASAPTRRLYETTPSKLYCLNLTTETPLWEKPLPQGCDRLAITPDGKTLYVPAFEKDIWNVVDAISGETLATIDAAKSGSHNTICSLDGKRIYMAGLHSKILRIADPSTNRIVGEVGPFSASIRPFTINAAQSRCYICADSLLGFEIGDLKSGAKIEQVVVSGFNKGPVKLHGCPSHGIALMPDESELWLCDASNHRVHVFDNTVDPPKQLQSIEVREEPCWLTVSLNGEFVYPSTGEVIDAKTKRIIAVLTDENAQEVHSEKMLEIQYENGVPSRIGDQFGLGRSNTR